MKLVNLMFALSVSLVMAMNVLAQDPNNACKPTDTLARYYGWSGIDASGSHIWRSVGATAVGNPVEIDKLLYNGEASPVYLKAGVNQATFRFNISREIGYLSGQYPNNPYPAVQGLRVRYYKPNAASQVIVRVKSYNIKTGITETLATFNSDECSAPVSANFQWRTLSFVRKDSPQNWPDQAYYVEVQLIRANASGNPALGIAMIGLLFG